MRAIIGLCAVTLGAMSLHAEIAVETYQEAMTSSDKPTIELMQSYVAGLGYGMAWTNGEAAKKNAPVYCPPEKMALALQNYIDILDRQIKRITQSKTLTNEVLKTTPISLVLLGGLKDTFPCEGK